MKRCLGIALLLLLPAALHAQNILFEERFTGGLLQNEWRPGFNGNSMDVESLLNNPSGDGWVGKLANHFSGGNVGATHSGAQFTDFYYEAQVYIPVDEGVYYGIEFRVDTVGLSSGYQFVARFLPGGMVTPRLRFRQRPSDNPGMPTVLRDWEETEIPGGIPVTSGWHKLAVKAQGHRFWFYYDDQMLPGSPILDYTSLSGAIGAYVWDTASPMLNLYIDDIVVYSDMPTGISDPPAAASAPLLLAPYPHPLRGDAAVRFDLPKPERVTLSVHDLCGRERARIADAEYGAGRHSAVLPSGDLPEGSYILRLVTPSTVRARVVTVLR
jgi:hypothetical protein